MITGSIVAIVTPMFDDGKIDFASYRQLIDWHIAEGTSAIVAVGTTGESPTVDVEEHKELIKVAVEQAAGRVPIIAGTGGNSTTEAIELTAFAKKVGAHSSLQVVPYYNKPTQAGMVAHFTKIAEAVDLPVILYNVPGRTVADLNNDSVLALAQVPGIIGLKDATGDLVRHTELVRLLPAVLNGKAFGLYSGNDDTALPYILLGGHGVISVSANIAPRTMALCCAAALAGKVAEARSLNNQLMPINTQLFVEPNPAPVKWALHKMGKMPNGIRLPLLGLSSANLARVEQACRESGVL